MQYYGQLQETLSSPKGTATGSKWVCHLLYKIQAHNVCEQPEHTQFLGVEGSPQSNCLSLITVLYY